MNRKSLIICSYAFFSTLAIGWIAAEMFHCATLPSAVSIVRQPELTDRALTDCKPLDGDLRFRNLPLNDDDEISRVVPQSHEQVRTRDGRVRDRSISVVAPRLRPVQKIEPEPNNLLFRQLCRAK